MKAKVRKAALYTRVSSNGQNPKMQESELLEYVRRRGWVVYKVYTDKGISGTKQKRPALDSLLNDCRRGRVNAIVVYRFDRFARSLKQLISGFELCKELGIDFVSITEAVDTTLPAGELVFQIMGAVAQFERSLIVERVKAGLQHARSQGKVLGRPPLRRLTPKEIGQLKSERAKRKSPFRTLATKYGISVFTAHKLCRRSRESAP
jgi:DNA invertase Pin-like site-specific DNA recombinase